MKLQKKWLEPMVVAAAVLLGIACLIVLSTSILAALDKIETECTKRTCSPGSRAVFTRSGCRCGPIDGCCAPVETP